MSVTLIEHDLKSYELQAGESEQTHSFYTIVLFEKDKYRMNGWIFFVSVSVFYLYRCIYITDITIDVDSDRFSQI